ncbi:hypothetical protein D047_2665B, partial [Vibrio parahaemolyticus VPTS-2010_2]
IPGSTEKHKPCA